MSSYQYPFFVHGNAWVNESSMKIWHTALFRPCFQIVSGDLIDCWMFTYCKEMNIYISKGVLIPPVGLWYRHTTHQSSKNVMLASIILQNQNWTNLRAMEKRELVFSRLKRLGKIAQLKSWKCLREKNANSWMTLVTVWTLNLVLN